MRERAPFVALWHCAVFGLNEYIGYLVFRVFWNERRQVSVSSNQLLSHYQAPALRHGAELWKSEARADDELQCKWERLGGFDGFSNTQLQI